MRVLLFDRTCVTQRGGLTTAWAAGAALYRSLGRIDAAHGVASWREAFAWLDARTRHDAIDEIQYWGHGKWGALFVGADDVLDASRLGELAWLRERLRGNALIWMRTCETFGAHAGHDFAMRLADSLGARVAGHTYVIGYQQSGLHGLLPGARPSWSAREGLERGSPELPERARWSRRNEPNTVTCWTGSVPPAFFHGAP